MKISKERGLELYWKRASIYDFTHHLQTLWADNIHRKATVKHAYLKDNDEVLDVCTGTGLTAIIAAKNYNVFVTGVDLSTRMLEYAECNIRKKNLSNKIKLVYADVENLYPLKDNSFDVILSAYGFGGVEDGSKAMKELVRVAKPNARISFAEMSEPPREFNIIWKILHKAVVEPWIIYKWNFRDLDLENLFLNNNISISGKKYYKNRILGSTTLIHGFIKK